MKYVVHELFSEGSLQVELTETVQETSMYTSMAVVGEQIQQPSLLQMLIKPVI